MIAFADLLERLAFTTHPDSRVALLRRYLETQSDPARGYALGVLTGALRLPTLRPATLRALAMERCDPVLFELSREFVGDLTETVALIWPHARGNAPPPTMTEIVQTPRAELPMAIVGWLDASDAGVRLALLKLLTGVYRSLATGAEIRTALGGTHVDEVWHAQTPPYLALFAWLEGRAPRPASGGFLPFMLPGRAAAGEFLAEPLWEGERVLISERRVFSRHADDMTSVYPEFRLGGVVVDGVVTREPRCLRIFDMLFDGSDDLRAQGFSARRARLEAWFDRVRPPSMELSPLVPFGDDDIGLILKRADSPYIAGSLHDHWVARPRLPRTVAAVLLYAEAGLYTVGLRRDGALVPVGQAMADDPTALDVWIRDHTVARYGPVREVEKTLVVSVTFGSVRAAARRKAGVVLEGARIVGVLPGGAAHDLDVLGTGV
jgi:DNA ligase-1